MLSKLAKTTAALLGLAAPVAMAANIEGEYNNGNPFPPLGSTNPIMNDVTINGITAEIDNNVVEGASFSFTNSGGTVAIKNTGKLLLGTGSYIQTGGATNITGGGIFGQNPADPESYNFSTTGSVTITGGSFSVKSDAGWGGNAAIATGMMQVMQQAVVDLTVSNATGIFAQHQENLYVTGQYNAVLEGSSTGNVVVSALKNLVVDGKGAFTATAKDQSKGSITVDVGGDMILMDEGQFNITMRDDSGDNNGNSVTAVAVAVAKKLLVSDKAQFNATMQAPTHNTPNGNMVSAAKMVVSLAGPAELSDQAQFNLVMNDDSSGANAAVAARALLDATIGGAVTMSDNSRFHVTLQGGQGDITVLGKKGLALENRAVFTLSSDNAAKGDANVTFSGPVTLADEAKLRILGKGNSGGSLWFHTSGTMDIGKDALVEVARSDNSGASMVAGAGRTTVNGSLRVENTSTATGGNVRFQALGGATINRGGSIVVRNAGAGGVTSFTSSNAPLTLAGGQITVDAKNGGSGASAKLTSNGHLNMTGGTITVESGTQAQASVTINGTTTMSAGDIILKGSHTNPTASFQTSLLKITGGRLTVGESKDSTAQLQMTRWGNSMDVNGGVVSLSGTGGLYLHRESSTVTVRNGGILRTGADSVLYRLPSTTTTTATVTVGRHGRLETEAGTLKTTNINTVDVTGGTYSFGANADGSLNILDATGNSTVKFQNKFSVDPGASVWQNIELLPVGGGADVVKAGTIQVNEIPAEWRYTSVYGDILLDYRNNRLYIAEANPVNYRSANVIRNRLADAGYATEKFNNGALGLIGGVLAGNRGEPDGITFAGTPGGTFMKNFYGALLEGKTAFTYTDADGAKRTSSITKNGTGIIDYLFGNTDTAVASVGLGGMTSNLSVNSGTMADTSSLFSAVCQTTGSDAALAAAVLNRQYLNRIWIKGFGLWENAGRRDGVEGYRFNSGGLAAGYDRAFGPIIAGANLTYTDGSFKNKSASAHDSDIGIYAVNGYATYNLCSGWFIGALGGFSYADNDIRERYGDEWTKDDFHSVSWYGGGKLGYNYMPTANLFLSPSVGLVYAHSKSSAHNSVVESLGGAVKRVGEMKYNSFILPVDLTMGYTWKLGAASSLGLRTNVGYSYNFKADGPRGVITQNGLMVGGDPAAAARMTVKERDIGHHMLNLGLGVEYTMGRFDLGVRYDHYRKADYRVNTISGTAGLSF